MYRNNSTVGGDGALPFAAVLPVICHAHSWLSCPDCSRPRVFRPSRGKPGLVLPRIAERSNAVMAAVKKTQPVELLNDLEPMLTRLKLTAIGDQFDTLLD